MPARSSRRFNTFSSDVKNHVRRVQASVQQAADLELRRATEMEKKFTQLGAETQFSQSGIYGGCPDGRIENGARNGWELRVPRDRLAM